MARRDLAQLTRTFPNAHRALELCALADREAAREALDDEIYEFEREHAQFVVPGDPGAATKAGTRYHRRIRYLQLVQRSI